MPPEKSSVAWFKLAEFVARREKERAIAVYRLLVHALSDEAYSLQLGGDLMSAFDDAERARDFYREAARHYMATLRFFQAGCIYEKLISDHEDTMTEQLWLDAMYAFDVTGSEKKIRAYASYAVMMLCATQQGYHYAVEHIEKRRFSPSTKEHFLEQLNNYAAKGTVEQEQWSPIQNVSGDPAASQGRF